MQHTKGLDTVRAVAALSVVAAHLLGPFMAYPWKYIFTGHPAVMAFFVVSGFCIHFPYVSQNPPIAHFLVRRALRILPPAVLAMVLAQMVGIKAYNFVDGYILWSVICEMIYYVLYPVLLQLARNIGWRNLIIISFFTSYGVAIGVGSDAYGNASAYGPFLNWIVGLPAWLVGCKLAEAIKLNQPTFLPGNVWLWRIATALVAAVLYWATMNTPVGFYLTMAPFSLIAANWIYAEIAAASDQGPNALLERVGKACYSIYLMHTVNAAALEHLGFRQPLLLTILSLCLVWPFYKWVEKPMHVFSRDFAKLYFRTRAPVG